MEVLHCDRKLFLVFEYLDFDLKKFMDKSPNGIPHERVKVEREEWRGREGGRGDDGRERGREGREGGMDSGRGEVGTGEGGK